MGGIQKGWQALTGSNPDEQYRKPAIAQEIQSENEQAANNQSAFSGAMNNYSQGNISLQQAMNEMGNNYSGEMAQGMRGRLATDSILGSRVAADELERNPQMAALYGKGSDSALSRAVAEEKSLGSANEMRPEDYERFGQESGDITRMYGQQEGELAKALQARGLGQSGAAGKAYAGQMGNKYEQLANLQRQVHQDAFNRKLNQMAQTRQYMTNLGQQYGNELNSQFGRQIQGNQALMARRGQDMQTASMDEQMRAQAEKNRTHGFLEELGRSPASTQKEFASSFGSAFGSLLGGGGMMGSGGGGAPTAGGGSKMSGAQSGASKGIFG